MVAVPATFKQYQYTNTKFGACADEWKLVDATQKVLKPGYVRIRVVNAALNPVNYKLAEYGTYWFDRTPTEEAPFVVGSDVAGTVVEVGADVIAFKVGDDVYTRTPTDDFGAVAEYIAIDAQFMAPKPKNLSFQDATGIPLASLTSYQALVTHAKLKAGETVLTLGGSSTTGTPTIQFAKGIGAHVIAPTSHRNVHIGRLIEMCTMRFFGLRDVEYKLIQDIAGSGLMSDYFAMLYERAARAFPRPLTTQRSSQWTARAWPTIRASGSLTTTWAAERHGRSKTRSWDRSSGGRDCRAFIDTFIRMKTSVMKIEF